MPGDILIVDDDQLSAEFMRQTLAQLRVPITVASSAQAAHAALMRHPVDLVLLDATLPDASGFDVCHWLRQRDADVAIMFVTGHTGAEERGRAVAVGADDFLCKPFPLAVLLARVRAILQQRQTSQSGQQAGRLHLDSVTGMLTLPDRRVIALTPTETHLVALLLCQPGQFITREALVQQIWGARRDLSAAHHALDAHIRRLRAKLEPDHSQTCAIQAVRGLGVRFLASSPPLTQERTGHAGCDSHHAPPERPRKY